ncbi:hypothetical protein [Mesoaciditoga sp.]
MKKTTVIFSFFLVFVLGVSFSWSFLETPTSLVLKDGEFQYSNVNLFSQSTWLVGIGNFSQVGRVNSSFLEQFQILKEPVDLSAGMMIGDDNGYSSAFLAIGKRLKSIELSSAISYASSEASKNYLIFQALVDIPFKLGNVRLEYKKSAYSNEFAMGIAARFSSNDQIKWLFKTLSMGIGLGWDFALNDSFPTTYFIFQYTK